MSRDEILIGAPGDLFALPVPENGGLRETSPKFGTIQQSATGVRTVDYAGGRRDWSISWEDLGPEDCSLLVQLYEQWRASSLPIRLILPHRKNLLSASVSTMQSVPVPRTYSNAAPFYQAAGAATMTTPSVGRRDQDATYALSPRLARYTKWVGGGATTSIELEGPAGLSPWGLIPVVPGRTYTLSAYYRRTAGTSGCALQANVRREDGTATGQPAASSVALSSSTWTWASVTVTIPAGWHTLAAVLSVGPGDTLDVAAAQLEEGPVRTPWVVGRGTPIVTCSGLEMIDSQWPNRNVTLSLIEM